MNEAYICDAIRTPIGRFGGALSSLRTDDLGAIPLRELISRNSDVDWEAVDDVILGCANQAGEDNRNVARMSSLLAGLPVSVSGTTVNRLCGSGMDAIGMAARAIKSGESRLMLAGGVESMSRAPFVMAKADRAFSRQVDVHDTTIGWRFVNRLMREQYGVDSMPQTADNLVAEYGISRADQDAFALRSQQRYAEAREKDAFANEIVAVTLPQRKGDPIIVSDDEHPRPATKLEDLTRLKGINGPELTVTAGNSSGVNDGSCALIVASEQAIKQYALTPRARVVGMASAGVPPRIMGIGPVPAAQKLLNAHSLKIDDMDLIELNEAFASQALAVLRKLGIADDAVHVNPQGGAIALGHPLGMSGARLVTTATDQLQRNGGRYALCTMCVGVGQGIALVLESV